MDALEAIFSRRSIRRYQDRTVDGETVQTLLKAAMIAPTTVDNRDWEFVVVSQRERLEQLADCLNHSGEPLRGAPLAIVVCGNLEEAYRWAPGYWVEDCAAAAENILIAANALSLGAVWLGVYPQTDKLRRVSERLTLPRHIVPFCVLALGYPGESLPSQAEQRYAPEKVHYEHWRGDWKEPTTV